MKVLVAKDPVEKIKIELQPTVLIQNIDSLYLTIGDEIILSESRLIFLFEEIKRIKPIIGFIRGEEIINISKDIKFIDKNDEKIKIATVKKHEKDLKNQIVYEMLTEREINDIIVNSYFIDSDCFYGNIFLYSKYQNIAIIGEDKIALTKVINARHILS